MAVTGTPIKNLPEAAQSALTDASDMIIEDASTTRRTKLSTLAAWLKAKFGITTINTNITNATGRITAVEGRATGVENRISSAEKKIANSIFAELRNGVRLTSDWCVIADKPGYILAGVYNVRDDTYNQVKGINKRTGTGGYTVIVEGADNQQVALYLVWVKLLN